MTTTRVPVGVMVDATTSHELGPLTTTSLSSSNALTLSRLTPSPSGTTNCMPLVKLPAAASLVLNDVGATNVMVVPTCYAVAVRVVLGLAGCAPADVDAAVERAFKVVGAEGGELDEGQLLLQRLRRARAVDVERRGDAGVEGVGVLRGVEEHGSQ
jgi:hypothetical protein